MRDRAVEQAGTIFRQSGGYNLSKHLATKVGEKTDYIQKEAEYHKQLEKLQGEHKAVCATLMMAGIGVYFVECIFSVACCIYFGCLFGSCENQLVCFIHYIKFV